MSEIFSYWQGGGGWGGGVGGGDGGRNMIHAILGCVPVHIKKCIDLTYKIALSYVK